MNKRTQKAIAASKGRRVYYLTEEEAAVVDKMRQGQRSAKSSAALKCKHSYGGALVCLARAKREGYCLNHWNMLQRRQSQEA